MAGEEADTGARAEANAPEEGETQWMKRPGRNGLPAFASVRVAPLVLVRESQQPVWLQQQMQSS